MPDPIPQDSLHRDASPAETTPGTRDESPESYLKVLPVGPHRVFAYWRLTPELRRRAERTVTRPAAAGGLVIRVFRLDHGNDDLTQALATENFPVDETQTEAYFSLRRPGGFVAAVLGVQDHTGRFSPLLRAPRAALPEAPAPPKSGTGRRNTIEEGAVLRGANALHLPSELLRMPEDTAAGVTRTGLVDPRDPSPHEPAVPETPAIDERRVVAAALAAPPEDAPAPPGPSSQPAAGRPAPAVSSAPLSSAHLSGADEEESGAPLTLRATLIIEGCLRPGERLWIDRIEPDQQPGGRFVWVRRVTDFLAAWRLLRDAAGTPPPPAGFVPANGPRRAPFPIRFSVEIEGAVRDPAYLARLPREISVDAAGRFLLIRPISPRHPAVPAWKLDRRGITGF